MNLLDVVKAVVRLTKGERQQLLAILRAECPDEWREVERAYVAERQATITTTKKST